MNWLTNSENMHLLINAYEYCKKQQEQAEMHIITAIIDEFKTWRSAILDLLDAGKWPLILEAMKESGYDVEDHYFDTNMKIPMVFEALGTNNDAVGIIVKIGNGTYIDVSIKFGSWPLPFPDNGHEEELGIPVPKKNTVKVDVMSDSEDGHVTTDVFLRNLSHELGKRFMLADHILLDCNAACYLSDEDPYSDFQTVLDILEESLALTNKRK